MTKKYYLPQKNAMILLLFLKRFCQTYIVWTVEDYGKKSSCHILYVSEA